MGNAAVPCSIDKGDLRWGGVGRPARPYRSGGALVARAFLHFSDGEMWVIAGHEVLDFEVFWFLLKRNFLSKLLIQKHFLTYFQF